MNTSYQKWLNDITPSLIDEEDAISLPHEIELQSLWYQGAFGLDFQTINGLPVKIEYLGEWNHGAGPDFLECIVTLNGEEKRGAIELDLSPAHWEIHQHSTNPTFDNVILHVSFTDTHKTTFCRNSQHHDIPQVKISPEILKKALDVKINSNPETIPGFCAEEFQQWSKSDVQLLIKEASQYRLHKKASKLGKQIEAIGLSETMWQALASTLGYRPNQVGMRLLSQRVTAKELTQYKDPKTHLAILLGISQFLSPDLHSRAPEDTQNYLNDLWDEWWKKRRVYELIPSRNIPWKMYGQRPVNHPHRRVASLAILYQCLPQIVNAIEMPNSQRLLELKDTLCGETDDFWSHHFTLTSARSKKKMKLFGEGKFKELLNNFIIPIWYIQDQEAAFAFYSKIRSHSKNSEVRKALGRLFPHHPAKADLSKFSYQQQGLQQLYRDFCLKSGCLQCPFPKLNTPVTYD